MAAVRGFMVAANKTDLQAMAALWGDQTASLAIVLDAMSFRSASCT